MSSLLFGHTAGTTYTRGNCDATLLLPIQFHCITSQFDVTCSIPLPVADNMVNPGLRSRVPEVCGAFYPLSLLSATGSA